MTDRHRTHDVLVLGGSGAVGRELLRLLAGADRQVVAGARRRPVALPPGVGFCPLDARDPTALAAATASSRVAIDTTGLDDHGTIAATVLATGTHLIDLSADPAHLAALRRLHTQARAAEVTVLTEVGLAPGLTNLLATATHARTPAPGTVELNLVLGLGEHHGPTATRWMLDQLAAPPRHPSRRAWLPAGFGRRTLRWADFAEQHTLTHDLGVDVVSRVALDPPLLGATTLRAARIPGARRLLLASARTAPNLTRRDWWLAAATTPDGTRAWASGRRQNTATAAVAAHAVTALTRTQPPHGEHPLHHLSELTEITPWLHEHGIATALEGPVHPVATAGISRPRPTPEAGDPLGTAGSDEGDRHRWTAGDRSSGQKEA